MNFAWRDYDPKTMRYIEKWLDESAVKSTGLDEGFSHFYEYWAKEDGFVVGENFWCKVAFENDKPIAVIAFCRHENKMILMEIVVEPEKRGQGRGVKLLKELLESEETSGFATDKWEAVIYLNNTASQKAFEKAGFQYHHTHEDGDAVIYVYEHSLEERDMDQQDIFAWCDAHFDEQLQLLKTLAAIPAPSHQEQKRAAFIRDWLLRQSASRVEIDPALNVVLPFGCEGKSDIRVYMAHTDVVFPDTEPLPVREEGGRLYAPGVGDDTANVTALMLCAKFFLTHPECLKTPVLMVFNSCEEGFGNLKGVRQIMADYAGRVAELISFDLEYTSMVNRAVGSERWLVRAETCGGHSYSAFGNPNAIAGLSKLITRLYEQPIPHISGTKTTYNVGTIQGGTSVNTIAQNAEMTYEYRSDDHACLEQMRKQFLALVEQQNSAETKLAIEPLGERPCGNAVPPEAQARLLNRCASVIQEVTGSAPKFCSASTDANIPLSLGVPATTFGLYLGAKSHTREEYIEIDSLKPGLRIALSVMMQE